MSLQKTIYPLSIMLGLSFCMVVFSANAQEAANEGTSQVVESEEAPKDKSEEESETTSKETGATNPQEQSNQKIASEIAESIKKNPLYAKKPGEEKDNFDITIVVEDGKAWIKGEVSNEAQKQIATLLTQVNPEINIVVNELKIKPAEEPAKEADEPVKEVEKTEITKTESTPVVATEENKDESEEKVEVVAEDSKTVTTKTKSLEETKIRFSFRFQPWADVLDWFAEKAGFSLIMDAPPQGTFNYTDEQYYTPAQAIDLLNSVLLTKGYTLVRKKKMLIVVNLEDGIPPNLVTMIELSKLDEAGEFELVKVLFPLSRMTSKDAQEEIKNLIGPQGAIVTLPSSGHLLVTETAGRLRTIRSVIESIENPGSKGGENFVKYKLEHADIGEVLEIAKQLLDIDSNKNSTDDKSLKITSDLSSNSLIASGRQEKLTQVQEIVKMLDVEDPDAASKVLEQPQLEVYSVTDASSESVFAVLQTLLSATDDTRVAIDPITGNIVALATPTEHATIRATIAQMEKDKKVVEVIYLSYLDPQLAVLSINKMFGAAEEENPNAPIIDADIDSSNLIIRGTQKQIDDIKDFLTKMGESTDGTADPQFAATGDPIRMIPMSPGQSDSILKQIEMFWPTMRTNRIRRVTPQEIGPGMRSGSTEESLQDLQKRVPGIQLVVPQTDLKPEGATRGSDSGLIPADLLDFLRPSLPVNPNSLPRKSAPSEEKGSSKEDALKNQSTQVLPEGSGKPKFSIPVHFAKQTSQSTTKNQSKTASGSDAEEAPPILISQTQSGIIIASKDLEALNQFEALITSLSSDSMSGGPDFTVFYLKSAAAVTVAETLNEIFGSGGGTADTGGGGGGLLGNALGGLGGGLMGGLLGLGGGGGGAMDSLFGSSTDLMILPETRLNALVVRGTPQEVEAIEQLLKVLDQPEVPESEVNPKPRILPIKNTSAEEVATILRQVYSDRLNSGSTQQRQPNPEEILKALRGGKSSSRSTKSATQIQKITIGVDTRSNSLIVVASQQMYEEVKALVDTIDQSTPQTTEVTQIVTLKKTTTSSIQEALSAIVGAESVTSSGGKKPSTSGSSKSSSSSSKSQSSSSSSSAQKAAEEMRRRIEFFNRLRQSQGTPQPSGGSKPSSSGSSRPSFSPGRGR
jgi:type II secretory pathway component GspD/PulD (secretin)